VGFFDSVFGRTKPVQPDLDALFSLPSVALTLQAALDYVPTGVGSVAFRAPAGRAFAEVQADIQELLDLDDGPKVEIASDSFGFTWLVIRREAQDLPGLVTDLHAINSTLKDSGFGSTLLCSMVCFRGPTGQVMGLVYLFKQGTFYPFVPLTEQTRDNMVELQIRDQLTGELPFEKDLARWFAVWGAPGL
jgi:hypothetical protein